MTRAITAHAAKMTAVMGVISLNSESKDWRRESIEVVNEVLWLTVFHDVINDWSVNRIGAAKAGWSRVRNEAMRMIAVVVIGGMLGPNDEKGSQPDYQQGYSERSKLNVWNLAVKTERSELKTFSKKR